MGMETSNVCVRLLRALAPQLHIHQIWLPHTGLARDDVVLEAGRLHFSAPAWGAQLSRRGGTAILDACSRSVFSD